MKALAVRRVTWGAISFSVVIASVLALTPVSLQGQEADTSSSSEKKEKLTGRLPAYYGEVVSKDQRTKIYEIQTKFGDQIRKLREQIASLEMQQKTEVEAVLTPEQREQVAKRMSDAKAKRSKKEPAEPAAEPASEAGQ